MNQLLALLLGASLGAALMALLLGRVQRAFRARGLRRRFGRAAEKEREAGVLLRSWGFAIEQEQARGMGQMRVDGAVVPFDVKVDYLVRHRGRRYAVEVKSGARATDPRFRDTRRQLREYAEVFRADGLLLLDMEREQLHRVGFPSPGGRAPALAGILLVGAIFGAAAVLALLAALS